jgi:hypothetical protein
MLGFDSAFLFLDALNKIYGVLMFTGISDGLHDLWRTDMLAPTLNQSARLDMAQAVC